MLRWLKDLMNEGLRSNSALSSKVVWLGGVAYCQMLLACNKTESTVTGYEYRSTAQGTMILFGENQEPVRALTVGDPADSQADCAPVFSEVEEGLPPQWRVGGEPGVACEADEDPLQYFFPLPSRDTSFDWPSQSGEYVGVFYIGKGRAEITYHIDLEEDRGSLTPIPREGDVKGEPTSPDYYRRYRITAEIECEEHELPCEGAWEVDIVYEQPRDGVRWLYTTEE